MVFRIETYAAITKAVIPININPKNLIDPASLEQFITKMSEMLSATLSLVPSEIFGPILLGMDKTTRRDLFPKYILQSNQSTKYDHQYLKIEAQSWNARPLKGISCYLIILPKESVFGPLLFVIWTRGTGQSQLVVGHSSGREPHIVRWILVTFLNISHPFLEW